MSVESALKSLTGIKTDPDDLIRTALIGFDSAAKIALEFDKKNQRRQEILLKRSYQLFDTMNTILLNDAKFKESLALQNHSNALQLGRMAQSLKNSKTLVDYKLKNKSTTTTKTGSITSSVKSLIP